MFNPSYHAADHGGTNDHDDHDDDRLAGPHWGGFWPAEHVPELDEVFFEPARPKRAPAGFSVWSDRAVRLATFDDRWRAIGALNRWSHAAYVTLEGVVVARRESSVFAVGEKARAA